MSSNQKKNLPLRIIYSAFMTLVILTFAFLLHGIGKRKVDYSFNDTNVYDWNNGWCITTGTIMGEEMDLPVNLPVKHGESVTLTKKLPFEISGYNCLMLESKRQEVFVYVNDELRVSYAEDAMRMSSSLPIRYVMVPLFRSDSEAVVKIVVSSNTYFSGVIDSIFLGNEASIILRLIKHNAPWLALISVISIIGLVCIVSYFVYKRSFDKGTPLMYLFWFTLFTSIWCFSQLKIRQIFAADIALLDSFGYCCFLLIPIPMILIINWFLNLSHKKVYQTLLILTMVNYLTQNILHSALRYDYYSMQSVTQLFTLATISLSIILCCIDIRKNKKTDTYYLITGLIGLLAGIITEAVLISKHATYTQGSFYIIGATVFLALNLLNTFIGISREQQEKKDAENASLAKSQFLATMSHEIRTPINAVLGMNEMILRDSNEELTREYASTIANAGKSLLSLVNDVLDFSKIESGKMDIICVEYNTKTLLNDLILMIKGRLSEKKLKLVLDIDESVPSKLYGDEVRIKQILTNLLTNAAKYTETGSITFTVKKMSDSPDGVSLYFSVKDTGIGLKEGDIEKLMISSFIRFDGARNRNIEGTGLGLSITRQLLCLMDSKLEIESEYNKGSNFHFTIAQKVIDFAPLGLIDNHEIKNIKKRTNSFTAPDAKILAVDDIRANLMVVKGLLKPYGSTVELCDSGEKCIELCKNNSYDIIFMDHMMPEMDGIETFNRLKSENLLPQNTKVVSLTANAVSGSEKKYMDQGFDGYITKPIDSNELDKYLSHALPASLIKPLDP